MQWGHGMKGKWKQKRANTVAFHWGFWITARSHAYELSQAKQIIFIAPHSKANKTDLTAQTQRKWINRGDITTKSEQRSKQRLQSQGFDVKMLTNYSWDHTEKCSSNILEWGMLWRWEHLDVLGDLISLWKHYPETYDSLIWHQMFRLDTRSQTPANTAMLDQCSLLWAVNLNVTSVF